jgi:hypothetical protein
MAAAMAGPIAAAAKHPPAVSICKKVRVIGDRGVGVSKAVGNEHETRQSPGLPRFLAAPREELIAL